jgi:hypothetical protein
VIAGWIIASIYLKGMTGALITNYLINAGFVLLKVGLYGLALWTYVRVLDAFWIIDITQQLKDREIGTWIFMSASTIALALIISAL